MKNFQKLLVLELLNHFSTSSTVAYKQVAYKKNRLSSYQRCTANHPFHNMCIFIILVSEFHMLPDSLFGDAITKFADR